ncbi:hypothetical protein PIROE2DRAFT_13766 [Piromyces sp. E2]|nr:hypothetical protein PIROE2DRAFT_13766 [Piromyces sp. E2]|eukprot:OUM60458.1 hypothetical protein PIROE2DRAFT_13766 [Piromyces sp. E2]
MKEKISIDSLNYIFDKEDYIEWKIDIFNIKKDCILKSPNFRIGNLIWRIELNAKVENKIENYDIILYNVNSFGNVYINCVFAIRNDNYPTSYEMKEITLVLKIV